MKKSISNKLKLISKSNTHYFIIENEIDYIHRIEEKERIMWLDTFDNIIYIRTSNQWYDKYGMTIDIPDYEKMYNNYFKEK